MHFSRRVRLHKWCHGFSGVPSPPLNLFLIPLRPLRSRVHMAINPSQRCHRAVIPNERLSNAIEQKKKASNSWGKRKRWRWRKEGKRQNQGEAVERWRQLEPAVLPSRQDKMLAANVPVSHCFAHHEPTASDHGSRLCSNICFVCVTPLDTFDETSEQCYSRVCDDRNGYFEPKHYFPH